PVAPPTVLALGSPGGSFWRPRAAIGAGASYFSSSVVIGSQPASGGLRASVLARARNNALGGSTTAARAKLSAAAGKSRRRQAASPSRYASALAVCSGVVNPTSPSGS